MKRYSLFFFGIPVMVLMNHIASAQTKKSAEPASVRAQIKPKFSEMVDYGFPTGTGVHELPGGKAPASNQINPDGSVKISRTEEIIVPAEKDNWIQMEKKKSDNKSAPKKPKTKKINKI